MRRLLRTALVAEQVRMVQAREDVPTKRDRKRQKEQADEKEWKLDQHEQHRSESEMVQESNAVHHIDSRTNDHPAQLRDHEHHHITGLHQATPGFGQRLGEIRPYTIHARGPSRCDIGNNVLWLNDMNGKWVGWCLHLSSNSMGCGLSRKRWRADTTMRRVFAPMGDVSSAPRDEPSTCRALRAQRRPRGAARTRGHGAPTPAKRFRIVVATGNARAPWWVRTCVQAKRMMVEPLRPWSWS